MPRRLSQAAASRPLRDRRPWPALVTRLAWFAVLAGGAPHQAGLGAQQAPDRWRVAVEANGTLLYGAASQRVSTGTVVVQQVSPSREFRAEVHAGYGDARVAETGARQVVVRQTRATVGMDFTPSARFSPFAFGLAESSLQQRIASRVSGGSGVKYTFWRPDSVQPAFVEDASLSVAVLGEQTAAIARPEMVDDGRGAGARYRWSARARYRRRLTRNVRVAHLTLYQPTVDRVQRYTLEATTTVAVPVSARSEFTITHRERLDSEARDRGAPSNRDGQLLFGVRATF